MITIAGEQRKLNLSAAIRQSNGTISIKGKKELKLSDFNISPPAAMFGQIETGNEITVVFDLVFIGI